MRLLDHCAGDHGAVLQHIVQIDQIAVVHMLRVVVRVVEMDDTGFMGINDLLRQENSAGDVLGDLACHIVSLHGVDRRVLVRVFLLDLLVVALDQAQNAVIGRIGLSDQASDIAVGNILLCDLKRTMCHNGFLHEILYLLH